MSEPPEHRSIRSFVRRAGRMTASQQRALAELWPRFGIDYTEAPLDFGAVFGREAPIVLEIGFGNGDTLVEQAGQHPDRDFLGIEIHEPGIGHCLIRLREAGVGNLRLIRHDAVDVIAHMIPSASLNRVNLYFPDPWPKKRHHKRRIVQAAFIDCVADRLESSGSLHIATDWANYAEHIDEIMSESRQFTLIERREHDGEAPLDRPQTKFERRGMRHGHRIVDWHFARVSK